MGDIGHAVVSTDVPTGYGLVNGRRENLGADGDQVRLVVADVRDTARMAGLLRGVDVVYHLACLGVRHSSRMSSANRRSGTSGLSRRHLRSRWWCR